MGVTTWVEKFAATKKIKLTHKGTITIIVFIVVLLLDSYLGISFNFRVRNNLTNIEKVNALLQSPNLDSSTREYVLLLRDNIIYKESDLDYFLGRGLSLNSNNPKTISAAQVAKTKEPIKNYLLFFLSKWTLFLFLGYVFFVGTVFNSKSDLPLYDRLGTGLFYFLCIYIVGFLLSKALNLIPPILNNWGYNYGINFAIQFAIVEIGFRIYLQIVKVQVVREDEKYRERIKELEIENEVLNSKMGDKPNK